MQLLDSKRSLLVVIDMQERLLPGIHRRSMTIEGCRRLMQLADLFSVPVLLTEQYPKGLGPTEPSLLESFNALSTPHRKVEKASFSCCGADSFEAALDDLRNEVPEKELQIVVGGIETHVCVVQTTLGLLARGCEVSLCWEAVSGRGAEYREWALERMQQAGASITNHESVGFEWARDQSHPSFKAMNQLLRQGQPPADECA